MSNPYQNQNSDEQSSSEEQPTAPQTAPQTPPQQPDAPSGSEYGAAQTPQGGDGFPQEENQQYGQNQYDGQPQYGQYGAPQQPQYGQPAQGYPGDPYQNGNYQNQNTVPGENNQWAPNPQFPQTPPQFDAQGNRFGSDPAIDRPWYGISFKDAVIRFFKKYATFSGRASRSEYWWAYLFTTLVSFAISMIFAAMNSNIGNSLSVLWSLAVLIPSIAIAVRRLHDANLSGWWYFLPLALSVLGAIILLVSVIGGVVSAGNAYGNSMNSAMFGHIMANIALPLILSLLILLGASVSGIVLMCLSSKPEGARFDKNPIPQDVPFIPNQQNPQYPPYASNIPSQQGQSSDQQQQYPQNPTI
ncbi:DUF805 domain-containing protein [Bifidobacterium aquikefiricola]|uniref:DUF805 domain-containing protein n=1 Tax=Bifidobacterium aquikefiricola TaxID=3059038 RepID=A0AB39U5U1_9BIFI